MAMVSVVNWQPTDGLMIQSPTAVRAKSAARNSETIQVSRS